MSDLTDLTMVEAKALMDKKELSPIELTERYIKAAERGQKATKK